VSMTNSSDRVETITSVQRRRRWTAPEKVRMVQIENTGYAIIANVGDQRSDLEADTECTFKVNTSFLDSLGASRAYASAHEANNLM
jgi:hypothetical protein